MMWMLKSRSAAIWFLLVVVTVFSLESAVLSADRQIAATCVLVLAVFKARMIGIEFMELSTAPMPLRVAFEGWVVAVCAILLTLYWQTVP